MPNEAEVLEAERTMINSCLREILLGDNRWRH